MTRLLREIYGANEYPAELDGATIALRPGEPCPALDAALARRDLTSAAYVTAWNPRGQPAPLAQNLAAQSALVDRLRERFELVLAPGGWPAGEPDPNGEREPSLLVLGISREDAITLGHELDQAAIVVHTRGRRSELVMLA